MGFKSIQTKYILLVMCSVLASALLIGSVCVHSARETALREAAQNMNLTCESYAYRYDASLKNMQSSVETSAAFASEKLDSIERFATDESYRDAYAAQLEDMLRLETLNSPNVLSYYVRFSPELLSFERGFRFVRPAADKDFERVDIVRIQDYQENDEEYVGWYYAPIANGKTTWLEPYHNANFDTFMVSCVTPFYKDGELVGVVGMDIDFSTLVHDLKELRFYDHGYAFLCSPEGKVYYHPLYQRGSYMRDDVTGFDADLASESSGEVLYGGISKGERIEYAFRALTNGMRIVLRAPQDEISADARYIMQVISLLCLLVGSVSIAVTVLVCRRITKPLRDLITAASMITAGEYDVDIEVTSQDEVGVLARTLKLAAIELKVSSERMRQLAYKDALTGVRNKTAYDLEIEALEAELSNGQTDFGIAVFDVNDLKTANDVYGHEQGNKVIRTGCRRICMAFPHSPVFRIGGDEFVAVLRNEEIRHIDERVASFIERTKIENANVSQPQDEVHVAMGIAVFDPATDTTVQDVFNRADALMYERKMAMKQRSMANPDSFVGR